MRTRTNWWGRKPLPEEGGILIAVRVSDEERLERIKKVFPDEKEAQSILAYDKKVDAAKEKQMLEYDLPPEKQKIAQKFAHTGTRKTPTNYKWGKVERKPDATKEGIIAELVELMRSASQFDVQNLEVTNKSRQFKFQIGSDTYELTLIRKNKNKSKD